MGSRPVFSTANVQFDFALLGSNAPFSAEKKILAMTRLQVGCGDRKCWRCKKDFKQDMKAFTKHLAEEAEKWRAE